VVSHSPVLLWGDKPGRPRRQQGASSGGHSALRVAGRRVPDAIAARAYDLVPVQELRSLMSAA